MTLADRLRVRHKLRLDGEISFDTAWRVGSGREGMTGSDLGVMLDGDGRPSLPGSSIKGKLRNCCESLAHTLGLTACMLDCEAVNVSGLYPNRRIECVSDINYYKTVKHDYERELRGTLNDRLQWINQRTCDVCQLFGSPLAAARLRVTDGKPLSDEEHVQVRDSVVLDRDSHTAVPGLKYDFEVTGAGSRFGVGIEVENASDKELALLGAAFIDWSTGTTLGGFTSRGLGHARLKVNKLLTFDLQDGEQLVNYLTGTSDEQRYVTQPDWGGYFTDKINRVFNEKENRS